jgi:predicted lipoprotein
MAGKSLTSRRSDWFTVAALFCAAAVFRLTGCGTDMEPNPEDGFDRNAMLASTTEGAILPTYEDFRAEALSLQAATNEWRTAREAGLEGLKELELAREAWRGAMTAWQRAEVMQLGPSGATGKFTGAMDLRDEIYSWPTVNPCRIDQEIVALDWDSEEFFTGNLVNVYGLDALEYLLFVDGADNSCPPQVAINADADPSKRWSAISLDEIQWRRSSYAFSLSIGLVEHADSLIAAWTAEPDGFSTGLASAGAEGSPFLDLSAAMDDLFASLFYLETELKDRKLAEPLGLVNCGNEWCPEALESPFADFALENVRANLEGGLLLYRGGPDEEDLGLEELLVHNDYEDLDAEIRAGFENAFVVIDGVSLSALAQMEQDPEVLLGVHAAVKVVTDLLKGDMATSLLLEIPVEAANDND